MQPNIVQQRRQLLCQEEDTFKRNRTKAQTRVSRHKSKLSLRGR